MMWFRIRPVGHTTVYMPYIQLGGQHVHFSIPHGHFEEMVYGYHLFRIPFPPIHLGLFCGTRYMKPSNNFVSSPRSTSEEAIRLYPSKSQLYSSSLEYADPFPTRPAIDASASREWHQPEANLDIDDGGCG